MLGVIANSSLMGLPQSSNFASSVDGLYAFIFWFGVISFVAVVACLLYWPYKYSRKKVDENKTPYIEGHNATEIGVSIVLFVVTMIIFGWGYYDYTRMRTAPEDAITINVVGEKWRWNFHYPNGRTVTVNNVNDDVVALPKGKSIRLVMTSTDVLHSFFVPNFRVKQDAVPGLYTTLWFVPTENGEHDIFCAEYCGTNHSGMLAKFTVMEPEAYAKWHSNWELQQSLDIVRMADSMTGASADAPAPAPELEQSVDQSEAGSAESELVEAVENVVPVVSLAEQGKALFTAKMCMTCHSVDGSPGIGPSHLNVFGSEERLADGTVVTVDENYIRESLMDPAAKVTAGYAPAMPTYKGQLSAEEVTALIEYLKTLKSE